MRTMNESGRGKAGRVKMVGGGKGRVSVVDEEEKGL